MLQEFQHGHGDVHQQLPLWRFPSLVPEDPYSEQSNVRPFSLLLCLEQCKFLSIGSSRLFSVFGKLVGPLLSSRVRENIVYHRFTFTSDKTKLIIITYMFMLTT